MSASQPFPRGLRGDSGKYTEPSHKEQNLEAQVLPGSAGRVVPLAGLHARGAETMPEHFFAKTAVGPKSLESKIFLHAFDAPKMLPFRGANLLVKSAGPSPSFRGLQKTFRAD